MMSAKIIRINALRKAAQAMIDAGIGENWSYRHSGKIMSLWHSINKGPFSYHGEFLPPVVDGPLQAALESNCMVGRYFDLLSPQFILDVLGDPVGYPSPVLPLAQRALLVAGVKNDSMGRPYRLSFLDFGGRKQFCECAPHILSRGLGLAVPSIAELEFIRSAAGDCGGFISPVYWSCEMVFSNVLGLNLGLCIGMDSGVIDRAYLHDRFSVIGVRREWLPVGGEHASS